MNKNFLMRRQNFIRIAAITVLILCIPFVAMQFTPQVNWGLMDFVVAGTLLLATGLVYELLADRLPNSLQRFALGAGLALALLLVWLQLAAGIF